MPKFRKKPVVIEAVQFLATERSWKEIMDLGVSSWRAGDINEDSFYIETLEGDHKASKGDWIIKGVQGEFYPCKPDIFEKTYERVDTPDPNDSQMVYYIGTKIVQAMPESRKAKEGFLESGYKVVYEDGYESWSPLGVFKKAYLPVIENQNMKSKIAISQEMVDNFIAIKEVSTIGEKTTLVRVALVNGFEIIESSSCVDKENYSQEMGERICMKKIEDKIWMLLGFLLQTAVSGIKPTI